uniref:C-type lectin domain-containing protein n=1 Tax=Panagrolaimus davidi TaxID=227884 RepID=A0A914PMP4_9BILA
MMLLALLCMLPLIMVSGACPDGLIPSINDPTNCYKFVENKTNWFGSDQYCLGIGGSLTSVHDMIENMYISGEAGTIFHDSTSSDFWIGANNILSPGKWSWVDNSTFDFTDWDNGQPQNTTGTVCVASNLNGAKWLSADCFKVKPFVCLVKAKSNPTICSDSWTYYQKTGFCYKAIRPSTTCFYS